MPGFSDFTAQAVLDWESGRAPMPAIGNRFLALFTTAPTSDAGTGGTECSTSGTAYARVQVAGAVAATATWTTGVSALTVATNPGWVVPGMNVYDLTNSQQIGTVLTYVGTALTLTANAAHASTGSTDSLQFSAWPASTASSGTEPVVTPANVANGAVIAFAAATGAGFGTVVAYGLYDAVTAGNFINFDYLGNNKWIPFSGTLASPSVLTAGDGQAPASAAQVVVTAKFGGILPASGSFAGLLTVTNISVDTFSVGVNAATASGDGMFRVVSSQSIPSGVTASFAAATFTLTAA